MLYIHNMFHILHEILKRETEEEKQKYSFAESKNVWTEYCFDLQFLCFRKGFRRFREVEVCERAHQKFGRTLKKKIK